MDSKDISNITKENFVNIIDQHQNSIYKYCYHMLRNSEEAEDAVQEVFLKLYTNFHKYKQINSPSSLLYRISYNHCVNIIRKKKLLSFIGIEENINSSTNTLEETIMKNEFSEEITYALSKLSANERNVIILRIIEDMDYGDIASILNKKTTAVRKQYERAKKKIKKYICMQKGVSCNEEISII